VDNISLTMKTTCCSLPATLPLFEIDGSGVIISANAEAERIFELEHATFHRLISEGDRGRLDELLDGTAREGSAVLCEVVFITRNGTECQGNLHLESLPPGSAISAQFVCAVVDLTEYLRQKSVLQEANSRLKSSEARLRAILDTAPIGIGVMDADRCFVEVNSALCTLTGYTAAELLGQSSRKLYPDDASFTKVGRDKASFFARRQPYAVELQLLRSDRQAINVALSAASLTEGESTHLSTVIMQDITTCRKTEAELRLRIAALDAAANAIIVTRADGAIEWANPAFFAMSGYGADEVFGRQPGELLRSGQQDPSEYASLWQTITAGQVWRGQLINRRKDGSLYHEFQTITPILEKDGTICHYIAVKQDVSEQVRHERELAAYRANLEDVVAERTADLQKARLNAERLSQVKSDFLANMSHEIRTPMNAVLGLAQVGARANGDTQCGDAFRRILQSGELLLAIIDDILDFSKIEAGKLQLESRPLSLQRLIARAMELTAERAREKGIRFCVRKASNLPPAFLGDEVRLLQILINLLSNAIKFTDRGSVTLEVGPVGKQLMFRVSDTGIGMTPEQVSRLFLPFEQAETSTTRRFGGTGLGLVICHRLLEAMGGDIRVDSRSGLGSVFEVHLPLRPIELPAMTPTEAGVTGARLSNVRILVAEDNEINRLVLQEMLIEEGVLLTCVENGLEAVQAVEQGGADAWDAVLMDIMMPVMDGYAATSRLRAIAPELPIIAITAHAFEEERDNCLAAGMVEHLTKPLNLDHLVEAIQRHCRRSTTRK